MNQTMSRYIYKPQPVIDRKSTFALHFWQQINQLVLTTRFEKIQVSGLEAIPQSGPLLVVCNHSSRFDGLLVRKLIRRKANFLVSPNELKGFQGNVLHAVGAFAADSKLDLFSYTKTCWQQDEVVVIFPEGTTYYDGKTHGFKSGAARFALSAAAGGVKPQVLPMAILYAEPERKTVQVTVGQPVELEEYSLAYAANAKAAIRSLTERMHREVCALRDELGCLIDGRQLYQLPGFARLGMSRI